MQRTRTTLQRGLCALALALAADAALAEKCLPPTNGLGMPKWVVRQNPKGCWAGWWCSPTTKYVAVATKAQCSTVGVQRAVAAWLMAPSAAPLGFGTSPYTDPALRAVWEPERALLDALRPTAAGP